MSHCLKYLDRMLNFALYLPYIVTLFQSTKSGVLEVLVSKCRDSYKSLS
uniref:Uncharacterized protein n=1 Tax=Candidatus Kentrum eta TaxID=2126337 RepID=A0A450VYL1_9GAMM|nr:MAG: hypothetical protein BECKH772B_GA0070898_110801 [Candidatus Kentron sp. H]